MLEIDPFAAIHQLERRLAVEVEVPQVAQQPDLGPVADAGQECVHQRRCARLRRDIARHRRRRPSARCRDRRCATFLIAERLRRAREYPAPSSSCRSPVGLGGSPNPRRSGAITCGLSQFRDQRPPHVAVLRIAVQQDHRLALAGNEIVEPDAIHGCKAALDRNFLCMRMTQKYFGASGEGSTQHHAKQGRTGAFTSPLRL